MELDGDLDLVNSGELHDIHAIAGLLKLYLRELPEPILTHNLQRDFMNVMDLAERFERVVELSRLTALLPLPNYTLLRVLIAHLIHVVQHCQTNKMTVRNVGIVFSPTLNIPAGVLTLMMAEFAAVFTGDGLEMAATPVADSTPNHSVPLLEEDEGEEMASPPKSYYKMSESSIVFRPSTIELASTLADARSPNTDFRDIGFMNDSPPPKVPEKPTSRTSSRHISDTPPQIDLNLDGKVSRLSGIFPIKSEESRKRGQSNRNSALYEDG
jgi:hypothetical protein